MLHHVCDYINDEHLFLIFFGKIHFLKYFVWKLCWRHKPRQRLFTPLLSEMVYVYLFYPLHFSMSGFILIWFFIHLTVEFFFFILSDNVCTLIREFISLIFNVIMDMCRLSLSSCYLFSSRPKWFFEFLFLLFCLLWG